MVNGEMDEFPFHGGYEAGKSSDGLDPGEGFEGKDSAVGPS